jgi:Outer membrane protein Omp28
VIAYHWSGYPFSCPDAVSRISYYAVGGTPYVQIDGSWHQEVGGLAYPGTMYPYYRAHFNTRKLMASPLSIALSGTYNSGTKNGTLVATVTNDSTATISGTIQFAVTENAIPYSWGPNLTTVEHVCRDMLPTAAGEAVSIAAGDTIVRSRDFTISSTWVDSNIVIVVFVQSSAKLIFQSGEIKLPALTGVDENKPESPIPAFSISPNPFRTVTHISIGQGRKADGLKIFDISGRLVRNLSSALNQTPSAVLWDGSDMNGDRVASGSYIVLLETGSEKLIEKVLFLK